MAAHCDCNKMIYTEYVNKKLRTIKNILGKSDTKYDSPCEASQRQSYFISLLSKMFLIVRNF